jgi:hypothetical protein
MDTLRSGSAAVSTKFAFSPAIQRSSFVTSHADNQPHCPLYYFSFFQTGSLRLRLRLRISIDDLRAGRNAHLVAD